MPPPAIKPSPVPVSWGSWKADGKSFSLSATGDAPCRTAPGTACHPAGSKHVIPPRMLRLARSLRGCGGRGFQIVQLLSFLGRHQADLDQIQRADEPICQAEPARAGDRVT